MLLRFDQVADLNNAEVVAQYKDLTNQPMPIGEVEFFLSQNGLAKRSAITGNWEGVLIDAISSVPEIALLFEHLNGPRNETVDTTDATWATLCGQLLTTLASLGILNQAQVDNFIALGGGHVYPELDEAYVQAIRDEEGQRLLDLAEFEAVLEADRVRQAILDEKRNRFHDLHHTFMTPLMNDDTKTDQDWVAALQAIADNFIQE